MGPMDAFEQQLTRVATQVAGPVRPVDAMRVVRSAKAEPMSHWSALARWFRRGATTPTERGFSLFSALKLIAAGVIVALFGGFLLAGILTAPDGDEALPAAVTESPTAESDADEVTELPDPPLSPTTTEELLSGMVTEEVEPGVYRVISDGHHDLTFDHYRDLDTQIGIVAGRDAGIWFALEDRFFRLGAAETHRMPARRRLEGRFFEVAPDGTVWTIETASEHEQGSRDVAALRSFDGEKWTVHKRRPVDVEVAPDGKVWAAWADRQDRNETIAGYLAEDGWRRLPGSVKYGNDLTVTESGDIWMRQWYEPYFQQSDLPHPVARTTGLAAEEQPVLFRYVDGAWENVIGPHADRQGGFEFGPHGHLWVETPAGASMRFDGTEWQEQERDLPERPPDWEGFWPDWPDGPTFAPDGSLWADWSLPNPKPRPFGMGPERCDGVVRFVGDSRQHFLSGHCFEGAAFGLDGSLWLLGNEAGWTLEDEADSHERPVNTYVITPEAVAATE